MLVPWNQRYTASPEEGSMVSCSTPASSPCDLSPPGAAMRTSGPYDEYGASRPCGPTALTAIAPGYAAGYETPRRPPFPAAQKDTHHRDRAYAYACPIAAEREPTPRHTVY